MKHIRKSHIVSSPRGLVDSVMQEKQFGTAQMRLSAIPLEPPKWYRFGRDRAQKQAKDLARSLRHQLPNETFLVSFMGAKRRLRDQGRTSTSDLMDEQMN